MNVLCLGSEVVGPSLARELVDAFLGATFDGGERYVARLEKVAEMEREMKDGEVTAARAGGARAVGLVRHALARPRRLRRAEADDGGGRRHRRHLEPDDLPEGARRGRRLRRADEGAARARPTTRPRSSSRSRCRTSATRATCCGPPTTRRTASTATSRWRSSPGSPTTPRRPSSRRAGSPRRSTGRTCIVKIPATKPGLPAIEDCDRARHVDQHHADLLARALQGGRRGVPPRARAARRGRRRPVEGRLRRVVLRLARRHRGRQAARGGRQPEAAGQARDREREARVRALPARRSPARAGSTSRARARRSSAASGRRPRRRTRTTAT